MIRTSQVLCLIAACLMICGGCAHEVVPSSGARSATTVDQVKIYQKHPKKYEKLGTVTVAVTPDVRWDERGESTLGFDRLKSQAAALGANGLLLEMDDASHDTVVTAGYKGAFYQVPARMKPKKTILAEAIYVVKE